MKKNIAVAGTGYVGLSMAVLLAQHHHVTAVDIIPEKVDLINRRLREYNQSINPSQGAATGQPSAPVEEDTADVRTYLAFRCREGDALREILDTLDGQGLFGLFLLSPQVVEEEQDLIRRMLGSGHSIGLLAEGKNLEDCILL